MLISLKNLFVKIEKFLDKKIIIFSLVLLSIVLGIVGIITRNIIPSAIIFVVACFLIALPSGKYGLPILTYFFFLVAFIQTFFSLISSFYIFILFFYYICLFLRLRTQLLVVIKDNLKILIVFVVFSLYSAIVSLTNIQNIKVFSIFTFILYSFLPISVILDRWTIKKLESIITLAIISITIIYIVSISLYTIPYTRESYCLLVRDNPENFIGKSIFSIRFSGLHVDQNGMAMLALLPSSFFLLSFKKYKNKVLLLVITIINLLLTFMTGSKSYMICLFIVISLLVLKIFLKQKEKTLIMTMLVSILIVFFLVGSGTELISSIFSRFLNAGQDGLLSNLTTGRNDLWKHYMLELFSAPFRLMFGYGTRASYTYFFQETNVAHSFYINLLWDYGIIGTVIFSALIVSSLQLKLQKNENSVTKLYNLSPLFVFLIFAIGLNLTGSIDLFFAIVFMQLNVSISEIKILESNTNDHDIANNVKNKQKHMPVKMRTIDI